ncbi:DNA topoisomerase 1 [Coemansia sp. RSA 486]|nr:DNA topoisomerase 1 [Coemansia sp. RSA 486]
MTISDSEDEMPLSSMVASVKLEKPKSSSVRNLVNNTSGSSDSDSDDGIPLATLRAKNSARRIKAENVSESDSESDLPLSNKVKAPKNTAENGDSSKAGDKRPKKEGLPPANAKRARASGAKTKASDAGASKNGAKKVQVKKESGAQKTAAAKGKNGAGAKIRVKTESNATDSVNSVNDDNDSDSEEYKWWLGNNESEGAKWTTLEHHGVLFPPEYVPHGIPISYAGAKIKLPPPVEEVATFFAAVLGTEHAVNPVFQKNFFGDFVEICKEHMGDKHPFKEFAHCDFSAIRAHLDDQSAKRKAMTKEEKDAIKKERAAAEEKYSHCMLNGRREKVGNFRIEPPSLFRGRGAHPKTGMLKKRVMPEQVTINIGEGAKIPDPPAGHKWGKVIHDNNVTWLAMWKENINSNTKYIFLAAGSSLKGQSDMKKYEKARNLVKCVDEIRAQYIKDLKDEMMSVRQRATAMYLIDRYALRAGNEKGDDEADTVGCCSLRCEHVTLESPNIVHFDFLGKDSIRYQNTTEVDKQVWKNLRLFQRAPKTSSDMLFDRLNPSVLNKHLQTLMPGLTAKVFRTYNASFVFQQQLVNTPSKGTEAEKILAYNRANRQVAVLCNHQRAVSKGFADQMAKVDDKLLAARFQRKLLKEHLLEIAPNLKKKHPELKEKEPGVTASWIKKHLLDECVKDREKATKKFERDNEKLKEARETKQPKSVLKDILAEISKREKEIRSGSYVPEPPVPKNATTDKILEKIEKISARIANIELEKVEKDENKSTALSTSKINYIDPRISVAWCKKYNVPLEKIFTKTLREKFTWAMDVDKDWTF